MFKFLKLQMIIRARQRHPGKAISFCGEAESWDDCFTEDIGNMFFWYNVGKNTHVITEKLPDSKVRYV